jgi:hypothetical protein
MYDTDEVLRNYIGCALWSTTDESTPEGGEPMDANYGPEDIAPDSLARMREDVVAFLATIERERPGVTTMMEGTAPWSDPGQVGYDLWLTRNHHGTGFWDRWYAYDAWTDGDGVEHPARGNAVNAELGDYLTKHAEDMGSADLLIGDDGQVHM